VKKLLDMHDATLAIDNKPDGGTTVSVTFPADRIISQVQRSHAVRCAEGALEIRDKAPRLG